MDDIVIGVDFGTLSVRAVVAELSSGRVLGKGEASYLHGVMTQVEGKPLPADFALQDPTDYLPALYQAVGEAIIVSGIPSCSVIALGLDFTASSPLPVDENLVPLAFRREMRHRPHAYVKLWKHHGAAAQAFRLQEAARKESAPWLNLRGGMVSTESMMPKLLELAEKDGEIYAQTAYFMEAGDWVVSALTGQLTRSLSMAEGNGLYLRSLGYPDGDFLRRISPEVGNVEKRLAGPMVGLGQMAGRLTSEHAERMGLPRGIPVAACAIDSHNTVPAGGATREGDLTVVFGTSACHLLLGKESKGIPGVYGAAPDAHIPGVWGFEAGQSCVGDGFAAFVENFVPAAVEKEATEKKISVQQLLTQKATAFYPANSKLVALDWFNGVRSPLLNPMLTGVITGLTLSTKPEQVYLALLEASAMGTRWIIDEYERGGQPICRIFAGGGIAHKNELFMQICADVCDKEIAVCQTDQSGALGSAVCGAAASGKYTFSRAMQALTQPPKKVYRPQNAKIYGELYCRYRRLADIFA